MMPVLDGFTVCRVLKDHEETRLIPYAPSKTTSPSLYASSPHLVPPRRSQFSLQVGTHGLGEHGQKPLIVTLSQREGGTLSCAPSAVTDAGNGRPLSWAPSADAVAGGEDTEAGLLRGRWRLRGSPSDPRPAAQWAPPPAQRGALLAGSSCARRLRTDTRRTRSRS